MPPAPPPARLDTCDQRAPAAHRDGVGVGERADDAEGVGEALAAREGEGAREELGEADADALANAAALALGVGRRKVATLMLEIVAAATPASLASQE